MCKQTWNILNINKRTVDGSYYGRVTSNEEDFLINKEVEVIRSLISSC